MTIPIHTFGPLWTKRQAEGFLPAAIETYVGWERTSDTPQASALLLSKGLQLSFLLPSTGIVSSTVWVSADEGSTWTTVPIPEGKWLFVAWTGVMYVAVSSGTGSGASNFLVSVDGYRWRSLGLSLPNVFRRVGIITTGGGGYIIPHLNAATYSLTLDGGFTWQHLTSPLSPGVGMFKFASDGRGVVIGVGTQPMATYIRSLDGGLTFNITTFPASMGTPTEAYWSQGIFWVPTAPNKIWVSDDGSGWVEVTLGSNYYALYPYARGILSYGTTRYAPSTRSSGTDLNLPTALSIHGAPAAVSTIPRDSNTENLISYDFTEFIPFRNTNLTAYRRFLTTFTSPPFQMCSLAGKPDGSLMVAFALNIASPNGTTSWTSTDQGTTWVSHVGVLPGSVGDNVFFDGIVWDGSYFIVSAHRAAASPQFNKHWYSTDGENWIEGTNIGISNWPSTMMIARVGGGCIIWPTNIAGGTIPFVLPAANGVWHIASLLGTLGGTFNEWTDVAGDGLGNYIAVRKGTSGVSPTYPAIAWSADNGETWNFYQFVDSYWQGTDFNTICWDGNQWIITCTKNNCTILVTEKINPASMSDWDIAFTAPVGTASAGKRSFSIGNGHSIILTRPSMESVEGCVWSRRDYLDNTLQSYDQLYMCNLGPQNGLHHQVYTYSLATDGTIGKLEKELYPSVTFGETFTPAGSVTGRALTRRTQFLAQLTTLGLSVATHDLESLATGSITAATPQPLSFGTAPAVPAVLRSKSSVSVLGAPSSNCYSTSGSKYLQASSDVVLDFALPVAAIGFYFTNTPPGSQTQHLEIILTTSKGLRQMHVVPAYNAAEYAGNLCFWGIVDPTRKFVSVRIRPRYSVAPVFGIDDIVVGIDTATAPTYNPALTPNFIASAVSGSSPLTVQFEDTSGLAAPNAWWWDYNDDGYWEVLDTEPTPKPRLFAGTYSVKLMVRWPNGQFGTIVKPNFITVSPVVPVSDFVASVVTGSSPLSVSFTDLSLNDPASWAWDFQDNGSVDSTIQHPTFVYSTPGTYTVKLTTTNAAGSHSVTKVGYIVVNATPPVASFTASPASGPVPLTVNFTDTSTNIPTSWAWDFQDNGSVDSTVQNPSFTFTSAGTYTVRLTATNAAGSHSVTGTITVNASVATYTMDFEGISIGETLFGYYSGSTSSGGDGPGPNYGVYSVNGVVDTSPAAISGTKVMTNMFPGDSIIVRRTAGINSVSFYVMSDSPLTIRLRSGTSGSGLIYGTATGTYGNTTTNTMQLVTITASGPAKSITWEADDLSSIIYVDDLSITG